MICQSGVISHVVGELVEVFALLGDLLLELHELFLLTLADSIILVGLLSLRECIAIEKKNMLASFHTTEIMER